MDNLYAEATDVIALEGTAQNEVSEASVEQQDSDGWFSSLVPMVLIFAVFYFLLIRPQEKRRRAQNDLISSVKVGEEIVTNAGIYAIVKKVNDDGTLNAEISDNVDVKILKTAVNDITNRKSSGSSASNKKFIDKKSTKKTAKKTSKKTVKKIRNTKAKDGVDDDNKESESSSIDSSKSDNTKSD